MRTRCLIVSTLTMISLLAACRQTEFSGAGADQTGSAPSPTPTGWPSLSPTPSSTPTSGEIIIENGTRVMDVPIKFIHGKDNAFWRNCIMVSIPGGPEVNVGCNKDPLDKTTLVRVKAPPECNVLRLALYSDQKNQPRPGYYGEFNFSTANKSSIYVGESANIKGKRAFKLVKEAPGRFRFSLNDNGDSDPADINFTILRESGGALFTIENSNLSCD
jgi:hypothetical protein